MEGKLSSQRISASADRDPAADIASLDFDADEIVFIDQSEFRSIHRKVQSMDMYGEPFNFQIIFIEDADVVDAYHRGLPSPSTERNLYAGIKRKLKMLQIPFISCKFNDIHKVLVRSVSVREYRAYGYDSSSSASPPDVNKLANTWYDDIGKLFFIKKSVANAPNVKSFMTELAKMANIFTVFVPEKNFLKKFFEVFGEDKNVAVTPEHVMRIHFPVTGVMEAHVSLEDLLNHLGVS